MAKVKIYNKNNYIFIDALDADDTTVLSRAEGLAKDVLVRTENATSERFYFTGVNGADAAGYLLTNILDEAGAAYADRAAFETFYTTNTGNFNQGGATPQAKYYTALVYKESPNSDAPVLTVARNTLGYDLNIARAGAGVYGISGFQDATEGKMIAIINQRIESLGGGVISSLIQATASDVDGEIIVFAYTDGVLTDAAFRLPMYIEINQ